jgi:hypothetical protein
MKIMNRLPSYDTRTSRVERMFFVGLGLAATALIMITVSDAARFSDCRDEITAALCAPTTTLPETKGNAALTNLASRAGTPQERARVEGTVRPSS